MAPIGHDPPVPHLSIVSPVYRAEAMLVELVERIVASVQPITESFEIILVDDRSPDNSWPVIEQLMRQDHRVRGVRLSRNFGQHRAITAGLDYSRGEWVVVLDCDLQDRPEEIHTLYGQAQQGYELVLARRHQRQDSWMQKAFSRLFYATLAYLTDTPQDRTLANFGLYHRKVVDAIGQMRESARYLPTMARWVGFRAATVNVMHAERTSGATGYSFRKRLHLALDVMLAYSDKPLRLTVQLGLLISSTAFLAVLYTLVRYWLGQITVLGYASLIISIWFFSGLLLSVLGVVGLYVGKTFEGVKNRPLYIVDEAPATPPRA
ncbi:glycosyltransferase family 2 protein [Hymenobacter defluvii]|uniref:Glycosyltransferase family 2 protein n=1 Tax=Hymenobacter defluvii TaxID=2054411 RepID=A0ABS3TAD3_9BACT|nr:glycosyltransferase family 2 protein [Hymenobacter defluvii]MBO3269730.1 glycosyltransferase family 2 protein [Hymenobacter defluvii]